MALFGKVEDDYTKTGKGGLTSLANKLSFIPFLSDFGKFFEKIPFIGHTFGAMLGMIDTIWEAGKWAFQGKFASAGTVLVAGTVGNAINAIPGPVMWWANAASGVGTGVSIGTHARALTENIIGGVSGSLGAKPQVLSSYNAGIGSIGGGGAPAQQRKFSDKVAGERGQNPDDAYARYMSGEGGVHVNELQSAMGRA
jgi:hypothetical protein